MNSIKIRCYAKVNLFLDIIGKRDNGYHNLNMILQSIDLFDELTIIKTDKNIIEVECNIDNIDNSKNNIVYKAAESFFKDRNIGDIGIKIILNKNIPIEAGLGGGSSDACGTLFGLENLYKTGISNIDLETICLNIGCDVPFFIKGGTAQVEGIGEKINKLRDIEGMYILVYKGAGGNSTESIYNKVDTRYLKESRDIASIKMGIDKTDINIISKNMYNKFEEILNDKDTKKIKDIMIENGALNSMMTGSGSAIIGIFSDKYKADLCRKDLKNPENFVEIFNPIGKGYKII
ncbi:MAG: 4-(cytidine 5'-diphospho)-2-C-methyl-D-erythritol kinase [Oscillospiraceae bacterium]|nr:4-(cytidine 5'-diphospho)-2-C-methyl-D-erythritol kinase [Oscillospiraceae bacterium]